MNFNRIQKKVILILVVIICCVSFVISEENKSEGNMSVNAYKIFFDQNVNKEISVSIKDLDINITGLLLEVYEDGIIVETMFSTTYVPKESIAYAKVKKTNGTDEKKSFGKKK